MFDVASAAGRNHIARLNPDGSVDVDFNPGSGTDAPVNAVALQPDGKVLIGGAFTTVNGVPRRGIARLNADGSVDTSFNPGFGAVGGGVEDILLIDTGKILIAGGFTAFNGQLAGRVARLNSNGSLDTSFRAGSGPGSTANAGPTGIVYALAQQSDGKFLIAGDFTSVTSANGSVPRVRVARLNTDGSLDPLFNTGDGPNDAVFSVVFQPEDGRVVIGGRFTKVDNVARGGIARFNNDKSFIKTQPIAIGGIAHVTGESKVAITINTQPGFTYALEATSDFVNWTTIQSFTATEDVTTLEQEINAEYQFYRVRRIAP